MTPEMTQRLPCTMTVQGSFLMGEILVDFIRRGAYNLLMRQTMQG